MLFRSEGHFRADLLHRLRVIEIKVPTLRERGEDVALLARHFLDQFGGRYAKPGIDLAPAALKLLQLHDWPGNVRELRNVIEQAVLVARDRHLEPADLYLPASLSTRRDGMSASIGTGGNEQVSSLSSMERDQIRLGLEKSGWNIKIGRAHV